MSRSRTAALPVEEVACVVCGGTTHEIVCPASDVEAQLAYLRRFHRRRLRAGAVNDAALEDRADFTQSYITDIVSCVACGLLFRSPRPTDDAVTRRYARDHYDREFLERAFTAQLPLARAHAARLARWLPARPALRIVEVGSFVGSFLEAGHERGWNMLGVDPGLDVSTFCRQRGLPVYRGVLPHAPFEATSVDAVTIWNTFDQIPDPEPILKAAIKLLRPGGILAIRVPNGACFRWAQRLLRRRAPWNGWLRATLAWNNLLAFPYLYGYSLATLDRLVCRPPLTRVAVNTDVLVPLADDSTARWAALEERTLKAIDRIAGRLEYRLNGSPTIAPWLDVYYRAAG
ncbi:MAG TPA: methyltransferase domain-containing protein [Nitrospirales bacterium]|nr:methyltransferase domain-containing protein [Nitrospirales bacterium]